MKKRFFDSNPSSRNEKTARAISSILLELMKEETIIPDNLTRQEEPRISIYNYILHYMNSLRHEVEIKMYIIMLIYIESYLKYRLKSLNKLNVHNLIAVSLLLAIKFHIESFYNNTFYSKIAGISLKELNFLEAEFFLKGLDGRHLHIEMETLEECSSRVQARF